MCKFHGQVINPVRHGVLCSARENCNGRVFWRGGVGGGSGGSRFGAPSRVLITEKIVEIETNTKLVVGLKGIRNAFFEFLWERRMLEDRHHGRGKVVRRESCVSSKPGSVI